VSWWCFTTQWSLPFNYGVTKMGLFSNKSELAEVHAKLDKILALFAEPKCGVNKSQKYLRTQPIILTALASGNVVSFAAIKKIVAARYKLKNAERATVDAIAKLVAKGKIKRIARGSYQIAGNK
jgi:hypothetical protein